MKRCKWLGAASLAFWFASSLSAQVPVAPPPPAAPVGIAVPAAPVGPQSRLGKLFADMAAHHEACRERLCNSAFGQLLNNTMKPMSAFSGGVIPSLCPPTPSAEDLAKPSTGPDGAAAQIKKDEAEAKARRASVRYLGTVDCDYWPEAQAGLINGLRADRNECVRLEAAWALARGCCCNKAVIEALSLTVAGSEADGNPAEKSERVRAAAHVALARCLDCLMVAMAPLPAVMPELPKPPVETAPPPKPPVETVPAPEKRALSKKVYDLIPAYYRRVDACETNLIAERARIALGGASFVTASSARPPQGETGLLQILADAAPASRLPAAGSGGPERAEVLPRVSRPVTLLPGSLQRVLGKDETVAALPVRPREGAPSLTHVRPDPVPPVSIQAAPPVVVQRPPVLQPVPTRQSPERLPPGPGASGGAVAGRPHALLVARLRESEHTEIREWAANQLAAADWRGDPQVAQVLVKAAREDTAIPVRLACIRGLARAEVGDVTVISVLQTLTKDNHVAVRREAAQSLTKLVPVERTSAPGPVQATGTPVLPGRSK